MVIFRRVQRLELQVFLKYKNQNRKVDELKWTSTNTNNLNLWSIWRERNPRFFFFFLNKISDKICVDK